MGRLHSFFNSIISVILRRQNRHYIDIQRQMNPEALENAMKEARFLHHIHAVDVRTLSPGEKATIPTQVSDTTKN